MQDGIPVERVPAEDVETEPAVAYFLCGPNRTCKHVFDKWEEFRDSDGCYGGTAVCSLCGESAFNISLWDGI
jgi:hypothetical protein